jgi:hypothetical protein
MLCRLILERWAEPTDLLVAKVSSAEDEVDATRESPDKPTTDGRDETRGCAGGARFKSLSG